MLWWLLAGWLGFGWLAFAYTDGMGPLTLHEVIGAAWYLGTLAILGLLVRDGLRR